MNPSRTESELVVQENASLRGLTTMGVGGAARYLVEVRDPAHIAQTFAFARERSLPVWVLGGGSNVIIHDDGFDGVVLRMALRGTMVLQADETSAVIRVAAGEEWDLFVAHVVQHGWWGIENLSLIPGTVGAVPIQNVGAYGQEVCDVIKAVEAWDSHTREWCLLGPDTCGFGYRHSAFNSPPLNRMVIAAVMFQVSMKGQPTCTHPSVIHWLEVNAPDWEGLHPDAQLKLMRECIMALRTDGRLPDVTRLGNAGSFFKNSVVNADALGQLEEQVTSEWGVAGLDTLRRGIHSGQESGSYKVSAAMLIRLCGLTGRSVGGAQLYEPNPIVMVNTRGQASASDVDQLAHEVIACVQERTGIQLDVEPKWIGFEKRAAQ